MLTKSPNKSFEDNNGYPTKPDQTRHKKNDNLVEKGKTTPETIEKDIRYLIVLVGVQTNIYDRYIPLLYIREIINKRTAEGVYINESLRNLRNGVRCILEKRERQSLYYTPPIDHNCLPEYCPTLNACFDVQPTDTSCDFGDILDKIKNADSTFEVTGIISVFCVLNIKQDYKLEPPNVPYIDINKFSQTWERILNLSFLTSKAVPINLDNLTLPKYWNNTINNYRHTTLPLGKDSVKKAEQFYNKCKDALDNIDKATTTTKFVDEFNAILKPDFYKNSRPGISQISANEKMRGETADITTALDPIFKKANESVTLIAEKIHEANKTTHKELINSILEEYKILKEFIVIHRECDAIKNILKSEWYTNIDIHWEQINWKKKEYTTSDPGTTPETYQSITDDMNSFIDKINEYNASSDIGTIAFLDNFAKSNTTKYICNIRDISEKIYGKPGRGKPHKYDTQYITQ